MASSATMSWANEGDLSWSILARDLAAALEEQSQEVQKELQAEEEEDGASSASDVSVFGSDYVTDESRASSVEPAETTPPSKSVIEEEPVEISTAVVEPAEAPAPAEPERLDIRDLVADSTPDLAPTPAYDNMFPVYRRGYDVVGGQRPADILPWINWVEYERETAAIAEEIARKREQSRHRAMLLSLLQEGR